MVPAQRLVEVNSNRTVPELGGTPDMELGCAGRGKLIMSLQHDDKEDDNQKLKTAQTRITVPLFMYSSQSSYNLPNSIRFPSDQQFNLNISDAQLNELQGFVTTQLPSG